jgi:DNA-binding IclR family transcriptional regulator
MGENNLGEISRDVLRELRDQADETSLLGVLSGTQGIVLDQMPSRQPVKFLVDVGASFPIHTSAPGKAIAAFLPENEQTKLLQELDYKRFTERTILDEKTLAKELVKVRNKGYAIDQGEAIEGLLCVAGPILDHRGYPVAAIWITGPAYRLPIKLLDRISQIVMEKAMVISRRLGYR